MFDLQDAPDGITARDVINEEGEHLWWIAQQMGEPDRWLWLSKDLGRSVSGPARDQDVTFHVDTFGDAWEQLNRTADWIQDADTPEHCWLKGMNMVGPLRELVDLFEEMEGDARAAAVNKLLRAICDDRYYGDHQGLCGRGSSGGGGATPARRDLSRTAAPTRGN
jgi:hypothetical protein